MQRRDHRHEHRHNRNLPAPGTVTPNDIWLAATWPFVRGSLPSPPATVVELGCGEFGGHVPELRAAGYDARGVDPEAPDGPGYLKRTFESLQPEAAVDAVVASLSLHHVDDLPQVLGHIAEVVRPGGRLIVIEWISEAFDTATAEWCFSHELCDPGLPGAWLARTQEMWSESGLGWSAFLQNWLDEHGLHPASTIRGELNARFSRLHEDTGPYFFPDLLDVDFAAEQAAIDAGTIRAGCLRYVGMHGK